MNKKIKIAAILSCHNRKIKTMACLESLFSIIPDIDVYLTDDGCTDGTPEAASSISENIHNYLLRHLILL